MVVQSSYFKVICLSSLAITMHAKQQDDDSWRKYAFEYVYKNNVWKNDAAVSSGQGSTLQTTKELRLLLPTILKAIDAHTLLDAGCGNLTWLKEISLDVEHYFGIDIVGHLDEISTEKEMTFRRKRLCLWRLEDIPTYSV